MESKQTAVQFLRDNLRSLFVDDSGHYQKLFVQALEMEKQQNIEFAKRSLDKALDLDIRTAHSQVEKYYNETYGM